MTHCDRRFPHTHVARVSWVVFCLLVGPVKAQDSMSAAETRRTEAGVIATDEHWSLAEMTGDTAFLDQLLLPEYHSVSDNGVAHSKAQIVADAATRRGTDLATANSRLAANRKAHPYGTSIVVRDNTAIVTFYDPAIGVQKGIKSSDVFVYAEGHWRAVYSQHTAVGKTQ